MIINVHHVNLVVWFLRNSARTWSTDFAKLLHHNCIKACAHTYTILYVSDGNALESRICNMSYDYMIFTLIGVLVGHW